MKLKNTPQNKSKFFSLYFGKTFLNGMSGKSVLSFVDIMDIYNNKIYAELYLRSIESLTNDELIMIAEIFDLDDLQIESMTLEDLQEWIEAVFKEVAGLQIDGYTGNQMLYATDYLRSIGIFIPYMGEYDLLIEWGWVQLR